MSNELCYNSSVTTTVQTAKWLCAGKKLKKLEYGVFTCSNWGWGYFNAYDYARHAPFCSSCIAMSCVASERMSAMPPRVCDCFSSTYV